MTANPPLTNPNPAPWTLPALFRLVPFFARVIPLDASDSGWQNTVGQVIGQLENLNGETERDFLAVGEKLLEFRSAAGRISSQMDEMTELISGEQGRQTSQVLNRILKYSRDMDAQAETAGESLTTVRELATRIPASFSDLRGRGMLFRNLCTLTRIETSLLGTAGAEFGDLADAVKPLSESIHLSGEQLLAASSQLAGNVRTALESGSLLQARQLQELRTLIENVMGSLHSFEERHMQAHEASLRQASSYREVARAIDELVQSVQFHDITRQQIEHVLEALRQLPSQFRGRGTLPPLEVQAVLHLQSSQLASAEATFASSVDRMHAGLESIAMRVRQMAETSQSLLGVTADGQDSFFLQMESCCSAILVASGTCNADATQIRSMATGLEETLAGMRKSVADIHEIEFQILRIAINATIRAAHLGVTGNALNTIAGTMHRLVLESTRNTQDAADALNSMSDAAHRVSANSQNSAGVSPENPDSDNPDILEEMRAAVLDLHSSSESSFSRVTEIAALGADLDLSISAVLNAFTAGRLFAEVVARARTSLQRLSPEKLSGASPQSLDKFAHQYTMQVERDIHHAATGGAPILEPSPNRQSNSPLDDRDLGDNVELF